MKAKTHDSLTADGARKPVSSLKSNGIIDAVIFGPSTDLALYLKMQNLFSFFIECMNNMISSPMHHSEWASHLTNCINHIGELDVGGFKSFNTELAKMLDEFTDDARKFQDILKFFREPAAVRGADRSAATLLTAKASRLQWLSVCILEELKNVRSHPLSDS